MAGRLETRKPNGDALVWETIMFSLGDKDSKNSAVGRRWRRETHEVHTIWCWGKKEGSFLLGKLDVTQLTY